MTLFEMDPWLTFIALILILAGLGLFLRSVLDLATPPIIQKKEGKP